MLKHEKIRDIKNSIVKFATYYANVKEREAFGDNINAIKQMKDVVEEWNEIEELLLQHIPEDQ